MTYYERMRQRRMEKGLTQKALANYLEISQQAYNNYESGRRQINFETALKIGEILDISLDDLGLNYRMGESKVSEFLNGLAISDKQLVFFRKFCGLPPNDQQRIIDAVDLLYAEQENKIALDLFAKLPPEEKEKVVQMIKQMYPE